MSPPVSRHLALSASISLIAASPAAAAPEVGSPNAAIADPGVTRPDTTPCSVRLFDGVTFADFTSKFFDYAPPAACPPPWAAVVLEADFAVTAGRQFDRTGTIWVGGASIYFGTTAEPSANVSRSWRVERDLTDYAPLFTSPQPGQVDLHNLVDSTFTGVLTGGARLLFYPLARRQPPPVTADLVIPFSGGPTGGTVALATGADRLARSVSLPRNVERAFLDVYAESQAGDEFWYACVPDDLAGPLQSCGGSAFREAEVTIDGRPAGVAPVFPWLFTGAIDPFLWRPIPGVQALAFEPYRVDLTPFAGILSDGRSHEIAVSVFGANGHFSTTANLLVYRDHGSRQVTGQVTVNTLEAPAPDIETQVSTAPDGAIDATVATRARRRSRIAGFVRTSRGRVDTELVQSIRFSNRQTFAISATDYVQDIAQATDIELRTIRTEAGQGRGRAHREETSQDRRWPLSIHFAFTTNPDQTSAQTTSIDQEEELREVRRRGGRLAGVRIRSNHMESADTLLFDASGTRVGQTGQTSSQRFFTADSDGTCYSRALTSADGVLTAVVDGADCGR